MSVLVCIRISRQLAEHHIWLVDHRDHRESMPHFSLHPSQQPQKAARERDSEIQMISTRSYNM